MNSIGCIGCGTMGAAIMTALAKQEQWDIRLYDVDTQQAAVLAKKLSCTATSSLTELITQSNTIIIAVKPQILPSLYQELSGFSGKRWISIAAGISLSTLNTQLKTNEVVRFMPNIAATIGKSVTAVAAYEYASQEHKDTAFRIAQACGTAFWLPESQFAAFTAISGSAIAYVFEFFHALAMGGTNEGIPYHQALSIVLETVESASALQKATGKSPVDLATSVCSAGGTTIEGMRALADGAFDATVMEAVSAAAEKGRAMEAAAQR